MSPTTARAPPTLHRRRRFTRPPRRRCTANARYTPGSAATAMRGARRREHGESRWSARASAGSSCSMQPPRFRRPPTPSSTWLVSSPRLASTVPASQAAIVQVRHGYCSAARVRRRPTGVVRRDTPICGCPRVASAASTQYVLSLVVGWLHKPDLRLFQAGPAWCGSWCELMP